MITHCNPYWNTVIMGFFIFMCPKHSNTRTDSLRNSWCVVDFPGCFRGIHWLDATVYLSLYLKNHSLCWRVPERPRMFFIFSTFLAVVNMVDATQQLGLAWGGGVMLTFLALVNMVDAAQQLGLGWGGMVCDNIRCTCTHAWCYATVGVGVGGMGCDSVSCWDVFVPCTCTHAQCSATAAFLAGMFTFFALALLRFFGSKVTSKINVKEMNPRLKTYVFAYIFVETRTLYGMRLESSANDLKKRPTFNPVHKMIVSVWKNLDFTSKPCVLQHFDFSPFFCICWKYCKGYKIKK